MYVALENDLAAGLVKAREQGLYKTELMITTPQAAHFEVEVRGEVLNLRERLSRARRSLGDRAATHEAPDRSGFGMMASVRFICGTQAVHRELEERPSAFLLTEHTILYSSCFDANGGLFEALLTEASWFCRGFAS